MHKIHPDIQNNHKSMWHIPTGFLLLLLFHVILIWVVVTAMESRVTDIRPTHLILKNEGCDFLKTNGIETKSSPTGSGCSVLVPFLQNAFGSGGLIMLGAKHVQMADDQVVIVGSVEDQPWTPEQKHAVILMIISALAMIGMLIWVGIRIAKSKE
jgi:flagellar biogenesis protein FliO